MTTNITTRYEVTEAQLQATHRIEDLNKHQVFYHVESATEPHELYTVYYDRVHKVLTCTCKAGQNGFLHCAPGKYCWHVRASLRAAEEYRREQIERQEADMIELAQEIEQEAREYTIVIDPTSSSLDRVKWEVAPSGRLVPMR
jgi:hypothetical protein